MTRTFHAPGRVNLIGDHTDYSGGLVLPAAIDRGITLRCAPLDGIITLTSDRDPEPVEVPADGSAQPASGWGRYVAAVAAELTGLGRPPVGLRGHLTSDLPTGAGLSSSAALEVLLTVALLAVADMELAPMAIAELAQRAEHRAVGVPCGIMDQAASVLGRGGHAIQLDCATLEHHAVPLPDDLAIVIVDSGVMRRLEGSPYAQRRAELESAVAALGGTPLRTNDPDEALEAATPAGPVAVRRLRHVVTENDRVEDTVTALTAERGADRPALARLFAASHASLRDDFEVTIDELDLLVELAMAAGAVAARMTGGGFGGAIVALVPREEAKWIAADVVANYARRATWTPEAIVTVACAGARELRPPAASSTALGRHVQR